MRKMKQDFQVHINLTAFVDLEKTEELYGDATPETLGTRLAAIVEGFIDELPGLDVFGDQEGTRVQRHWYVAEGSIEPATEAEFDGFVDDLLEED